MSMPLGSKSPAVRCSRPIVLSRPLAMPGLRTGAFPPADGPFVTTVGGTIANSSSPGGAWLSEITACLAAVED
jgi:hypothetical protein